MTFNPHEHMMQIKSKQGSSDYLPVQWRLVWANEQCPGLKITIVDKVIDPDREVEKEVSTWNNETRRSDKSIARGKGYAWFHVRVEDGNGKVGEAFKSETAIDFPDYAEKADTGATGRALAKIGYGTQYVGEEFDELPDRIVDAPVASSSSAKPTATPAPAKPIVSVAPAGPKERMITESQLNGLRILAAKINETIEGLGSLTYEQAEARIKAWTQIVDDQKAKGRYQDKKPAPIVSPAPATTPAPEPAQQIIKDLSTKIGRFERVEFSKHAKIVIRPEDDITTWEWTPATIQQARDGLTFYYNGPECQAWRAQLSKDNNQAQWGHLGRLITTIGKENVKNVRKLDREMATLEPAQLTQGMVDRLIYYLTHGTVTEAGGFEVTHLIPEAYKVKKAA